ncbi:MAG: pseudouridine synthase [Candidatus Izemoplasmataceae bacterium]
MERLQKIIAQRGYTSRRKAEQLIVDGKVKVDGKIITELGSKVAKNAEIVIEGKKIESVNKVYYVLYKPEGFISTTDDEHDRNTVVDLVPNDVRVFPVGRLDYDTSGVLILTNDGEFMNMVTSPNSNIEKEYQVKMTGFLRKEESTRVCRGLKIDHYVTKKAKINQVTYHKQSETTTANIIITEGKYHQVKKMFEAVGHEVVKLKRVRFGTVTLDGLSKGDYRLLKPHEKKHLYEDYKKANS